jgi:hypothetical protein
VPQSLVHNVDRISWIMQGEMPSWAFGLAGRSSSFGEVYGDMFDHHTVVYEYQSGARLYAPYRCRACLSRGRPWYARMGQASHSSPKKAAGASITARMQSKVVGSKMAGIRMTWPRG